MTLAFAMESDNRPRQVAKDLIAILGERGIELTNKQARNATARIYGHADWPAMLKTIGIGRSPDDADLDAIMLADRREHQLGVLAALGVPAGMLDDVRNRLAPTGRTTADVEQVQILRTKQNVMLYHPYRFYQAVQGLANQSFSMGVSNPRSNRTNALEEWLGWNEVLEEDEIRIGNKSMEPFTVANDNVVLDGVIVDASTTELDENRTFDASDIAELMVPKARYVHIGHNRLSSPWFGCGIEGCYFIPYEKSGRASLLAIPVVSSECETTSVFDEAYAGPEDMFLGASRFDAFHVGVKDGSIELDALDGTGNGWVEQAVPAVRIALAAALADIRGAAIDSMSEKASIEAVRALQRARTEKARSDVLAENAYEWNDILVRIVGDVPQYALDAGVSGLIRMDTSEDFPDDVEEYTDVLLRMMEAGIANEDIVVYADRVLECLWDFALDETWGNAAETKAVRGKTNALFELDRTEECFDLAMQYATNDYFVGRDLVPYILATLPVDPEDRKDAIELCTEIEAEAVLDDDTVDSDDEDAMNRMAMQWMGFAVLRAMNGDDAGAAKAFGILRNFAPKVIGHLNGDDVMWREGDIGFEVKYVLGGTWNALPSKDAIMADVLAMSRPSAK